jgi:hypothetical protein
MALKQSADSDAQQESWGAAGTILTTRGFIACVALPKAGACGRDGATAVIVAAGDDADKLHKSIAANFHPSVTTDCN